MKYLFVVAVLVGMILVGCSEDNNPGTRGGKGQYDWGRDSRLIREGEGGVWMDVTWKRRGCYYVWTGGTSTQNRYQNGDTVSYLDPPCDDYNRDMFELSYNYGFIFSKDGYMDEVRKFDHWDYWEDSRTWFTDNSRGGWATFENKLDYTSYGGAALVNWDNIDWSDERVGYRYEIVGDTLKWFVGTETIFSRIYVWTTGFPLRNIRHTYKRME